MSLLAYQIIALLALMVISVLGLIACFTYLIIDWWRGRKNGK